MSELRHNTPEALEAAALDLRTIADREMKLTERQVVLMERQLRLGAKAMRDRADRDRQLKELRDGITLAHATISATVLGIVMGAKITGETEREINRVVDRLAALLPDPNPAKEGTDA